MTGGVEDCQETAEEGIGRDGKSEEIGANGKITVKMEKERWN